MFTFSRKVLTFGRALPLGGQDFCEPRFDCDTRCTPTVWNACLDLFGGLRSAKARN